MAMFGYNSNPRLRKSNIAMPYTQEQLDELNKCESDPVYFATNYIKIVTLDHGIKLFEMWDFQKDLLRKFMNNRFVITKFPRQTGKSSTVIAYLLHQVLFKPDFTIAILANKGAQARELLGRLQLAYENLPMWMQQGVVVWNRGDIKLENNSRIVAGSTTSDSIRGQTYNILFMDEFAHIPNTKAEEFFNSTYPTITSGKTTQVLIVSTPKGMNLFYKIWTKAEKKENEYITAEVHWSQVPGRDEAWKEQTIRNTSLEQFKQEFEIKFLGSSNTLISGDKLKLMVAKKPVRIEADDLYIYEESKEGHTYALMVDVAHGQNLDSSAFSVIDITNIPYQQVARYRNNQIQPLLYPTIITNMATYYNDAYVLVEINDIGQQVADIIHYELEYENLVKIEIKPRMGQRFSNGSQKRMQFGLKTSTATKRIGCTNLKTLIESDKLIINDDETITELFTFCADQNSFAADEGCHDDLVMTLVFFGWFISQRYLREGLKEDIRKNLQLEQMSITEDGLLPPPLIDNGVDDYSFEENLENWQTVQQNKNPLDPWEGWDWKYSKF
jgi:hypothetical protein